MKNLIGSFLAIGLTSLALVGCTGDDVVPLTPVTPEDSGTPEPTPDTGPLPDTGTTIPAPPVLGAQIDRFGRPAVNTALNNTFNPAVPATEAAKDAYNADSVSTGWSAKYTGEVAGNLAILDSLDTVCGNQLLAAPGAVTATRYKGLADVLADDRVWINTASTTCGQYLAVEANATGVVPNMDCGGRTLKYDVIDTTYSVLAVGALSGVGDGIAAVPAKVNGTTFPYLAAGK
jgi:Domain of unknown function (DUF4331)